MQIAHSIALVMASLPVAFVICRLPISRPIAMAAALAVVALVLPSLWLTGLDITTYKSPMIVSALTDLLKFCSVLPLATWLILTARRRAANGAVR